MNSSLYTEYYQRTTGNKRIFVPKLIKQNGKFIEPDKQWFIDNHCIKQEKKLIGLSTFFHYVNYGTVLQAFSLKWCIQELLNCDVDILVPKKFFEKYSDNRDFFDMFQKFHSFVERNIHYQKIVFMSELSEYEDMPYEKYIIGSDQMFQPICREYLDDQENIDRYLLTKVEKEKKISYAASFGKDYGENFSKVNYLSFIEKLINAIKDISHISLRENVKVIPDLECECIALDPVLLYSCFNDWNKHSVRSKNVVPKQYDFYFFYDYEPNKINVSIKENDKYIFFISKKTNLEEVPGIEEWIWLIKNCKTLYTNSYHAYIFATIFNVPVRYNADNFRIQQLQVFCKIQHDQLGYVIDREKTLVNIKDKADSSLKFLYHAINDRI